MINKIFYVALAALWLQSCELLPIEPKQQYYLFRVENQTAYKMDIEAYEKGKLIEEIHLAPGKATERVRESDEAYLFTSSVDSVNIRFGGLRQIIQYCDGNALAWGNLKCPKIIKNLGVYETAIHERIKKKIGRKKVVMKVSYIFDSTDFDRAEPIQE